MKRLAVVTGGTRGIGAEISMHLKGLGYLVAANYAGNEKAAQAFSKKTGIKTFKWDVSNLNSCAKGVKLVQDELGQNIDILVNNAGITMDSMFHKMPTESWDKVIQVNLSSCFNMCKSVITNMRDNGFGRIVNISSINAQEGQVGQVNYSAAKAGMLGLTKSLAREGARKGITVNAVAPGYIKTEMTEAVPVDVMNAIVGQIPVGRLGLPIEIARAVAFLVSDDSGFITGATLSINGGHHMD